MRDPRVPSSPSPLAPAALAALDGDAGLPPQGAYPPAGPFHDVVRSEVVLSATLEEVWRTLTDFDHYAEWNAFTPRVETELVEGAAVRLEVHLLRNEPMQRVEYMHSIVPLRRLCWGMRMGPFLSANRSQWLIPLDGGGTLYRTDDRLTGVLTPVVMALYGRKMQEGFDAVCRGLAARHGEPRGPGTAS